MKITIETIEHKDQRYNTVGDWFWAKDGFNDLLIRVSDLKDDKMNSCLIIHELIEALLCKFHDPEITTQMVDDFDMSYPELDEPGDYLEAPYHKQHNLANIFENLTRQFLDVSEKMYIDKIVSLQNK